MADTDRHPSVPPLLGGGLFGTGGIGIGTVLPAEPTHTHTYTLSVSDVVLVQHVHMVTCSAVAGAWMVRDEYRGLQMQNEFYAAAQARSRELLLANLNDEQREELAQHERFSVIGGLSGERYFIFENGLVTLDSVKHTINGFCIHAIGVPIADKALTMAMYIRHDEATFLGLANWFFGKSGHEAYIRAHEKIGNAKIRKARDDYVKAKREYIF